MTTTSALLLVFTQAIDHIDFNVYDPINAKVVTYAIQFFALCAPSNY